MLRAIEKTGVRRCEKGVIGSNKLAFGASHLGISGTATTKSTPSTPSPPSTRNKHCGGCLATLFRSVKERRCVSASTAHAEATHTLMPTPPEVSATVARVAERADVPAVAIRLLRRSRSVAYSSILLPSWQSESGAKSKSESVGHSNHCHSNVFGTLQHEN